MPDSRCTGERFADLVEEGIDVAVRVGNLTDSTLIARRVGSSRQVVVGTPEYFERHGKPRVPQDLDRHNCILYSNLRGGKVWQFQGAKEELAVRVAGTFRTTSGSAIRQAVLAGIGIAAAPLWMVHDHLTGGTPGGRAGGIRSAAGRDQRRLSFGAKALDQGARVHRPAPRPVRRDPRTQSSQPALSPRAVAPRLADPRVQGAHRGKARQAACRFSLAGKSSSTRAPFGSKQKSCQVPDSF